MSQVSQIIAASYNAVLNKNRTPANQWASSVAMREMERQGILDKQDLGVQIEHTLDYQANPGIVVGSGDLTPYSLTLTEVLTAALYDPAEVVTPIIWSKKQEAQNPSVNQKIDLSGKLITNGLSTHDDKVEQMIFATSTNGFLGLGTHIPTNGQGVVGGIDAASAIYWRNPSNTYHDDTDIESGCTITYNQCEKGSGDSMHPTLMLSDATTQATFEGTQQANQRWIDTDELKAGFRIIAFKQARWTYSQYGTTTIYFVAKGALHLTFSREFFRSRGETNELPNATGYRTTVYSAGQMTNENKSRNGCLHL